MFSKVLLAVDGSRHSAHAVERAAEIAETLGSEVLVLHVRELLPTRGGPVPVDFRDEEVDTAAEVASQLNAKGVKATGLREASFYGYTPRVIVEAAERFQADMIIMGSKGRSDLTGLLLGSVTHKVLHLSTVPVLVVR